MKKVYLVNSVEWYESEEQAQAYLDIMSTSYSNGMVSGEDALLHTIDDHLQSILQFPVSYVDLGPGDGRKTNNLVSRLHESQLVSDYLGVDVQKKYLDSVISVIEEKGISTSSFVGSFEDYLLGHNRERSFIYLGATFGNFEEDFDRLLSQSISENDYVYLSSALFPLDIQSVVQGYKHTENMFAPTAKRKGILINQFYVDFNSELNQVELGFIDNSLFNVIAISKRPTFEQFKERVSKHFYGSYFANDQHIGFVGKSKRFG